VVLNKTYDDGNAHSKGRRHMAHDTTPFKRWIERADNDAARVAGDGVPMRDGVELAADVYWPSPRGRGTAAIVEVTPYNKDNVALMSGDIELYQNNATSSSPSTVAAAVSPRVSGAASPTTCPTRTTSSNGRGAAWCNGKVGTTDSATWAGAVGRSVGSTAHLCAMVSTSARALAAGDPYTNGVFQLYFAWWPT